MWLVKVSWSFGQGGKLNQVLFDFLKDKDRSILKSREECEALTNEVRGIVKKFCIENKRAKREVTFNDCLHTASLIATQDFWVVIKHNVVLDFLKLKGIDIHAEGVFESKWIGTAEIDSHMVKNDNYKYPGLNQLGKKYEILDFSTTDCGKSKIFLLRDDNNVLVWINQVFLKNIEVLPVNA